MNTVYFSVVLVTCIMMRTDNEVMEGNQCVRAVTGFISTRCCCTQSICAGGEGVLTQVSAESRVCVAASTVSPVRSVQLTAESLQRLYTQKLPEIRSADTSTVREHMVQTADALFCVSSAVSWISMMI